MHIHVHIQCTPILYTVWPQITHEHSKLHEFLESHDAHDAHIVNIHYTLTHDVLDCPHLPYVTVTRLLQNLCKLFGDAYLNLFTPHSFLHYRKETWKNKPTT